MSLYDADFYAWTQQQSQLLKNGQLSQIDIANLIEEIESMGKSELRELESRLEILFMHLLKWQFQSQYRSNSWRYSIEEQRAKLADHLVDNPSLKHKLPQAMKRAYNYAIRGAAKETGFAKETFPSACPWTYEQAMNEEFLPE